MKALFNSFTTKHSSYFEKVHSVVAVIAGILAFLKWLEIIIESIKAGSVAGVFLAFFMQTILFGMWMIFYYFIFYVLAVFTTFVPYLVLRGLRK